MKAVRFFLCSAALVLLLVALAKFSSSVGQAAILQTVDPVTRFQFQDLFRIVGCIEFVVALVCIFSKQTWFRAGLLAWLSTCFVGYRLGLVWVGYHKPCGCLGNLTDALHLSPQTADNIMKVILAYLLIGSYVTLFWLWRQKRNSIRTPSTPVDSTV